MSDIGRFTTNQLISCNLPATRKSKQACGRNLDWRITLKKYEIEVSVLKTLLNTSNLGPETGEKSGRLTGRHQM